MRIILLTIIFFISPLNFGHELKEINSNNFKNFSKLSDQELVFFISENCSVCERMIMQLDCLKEKKVSYIGVNSSAKGLRRKSVKLGIENVYLSNFESQKFFKLTDLSTPQLYIHKVDNGIVRGFLKCSDILKLIR